MINSFLAATGILACLLTHQTLSAASFGAKGNGKSDDTTAIQNALNAAKSNDVLIFPPGRYLVSKSLQLKQNQIIVAGNGAYLIATSPNDQTFNIAGGNDILFGLNLTGAGSTRLGSNSSTKIEVTGANDVVEFNKITGGASAGIFVFGGHDFLIQNNDVTGTMADGIHMTHNAYNGIVSANHVNETGDDMIAVVSYTNRGPAPIDSDILIEGNQAANNYWGRGISVVGGNNITIKDNRVSDVHVSAGIYLAEEEGRYKTHGDNNIIVTNNQISNIESTGWYLPQANHGAIYLFTWQGYVKNILVQDNSIENAPFGGFQVSGNACNIMLLNNSFSNIGANVYRIKLHHCLPDMFNICGQYNSSLLKCALTRAGNVTGSNYDWANYNAPEQPVWRLCNATR